MVKLRTHRNYGPTKQEAFVGMPFVSVTENGKLIDSLTRR